MIRVVQDKSVDDFLKEAASMLYADEATNSRILGLCHSFNPIAQVLPYLFFRILQDGKTVGAALLITSESFSITAIGQVGLESLVEYLRNKKIEVPGVLGPAQSAEIFAKLWSQNGSKKSLLTMNQKIYKIENVIMPNVNGVLRLAKENEADLIAQWHVDFALESFAHEKQKTFQERLSQVIQKIKNKLSYVWVVNDLPVSMANLARPTANSISVNAVYTPIASRKKGYASAVVAHLSHKMLNDGKKFCVLYTDQLNPTSNKIYQNIGYQEVCEAKCFLFE